MCFIYNSKFYTTIRNTFKNFLNYFFWLKINLLNIEYEKTLKILFIIVY